MNFVLQFFFVISLVVFGVSAHGNLCEEVLAPASISEKSQQNRGLLRRAGQSILKSLSRKSKKHIKKDINKYNKVSDYNEIIDKTYKEFDLLRKGTRPEFLKAREERWVLSHVLSKSFKNVFQYLNGHKYLAYFIQKGTPFAAKILVDYPVNNEGFQTAVKHYKKIVEDAKDFPNILKKEIFKVEIFNQSLQAQRSLVEEIKKEIKTGEIRKDKKFSLKLHFIDRNTEKFFAKEITHDLKGWKARIKSERKRFNLEFGVQSKIWEIAQKTLKDDFLGKNPALQKVVMEQAERLRQIEILLNKVELSNPELSGTKEVKEKRQLIEDAKKVFVDPAYHVDAVSYLQFVFGKELSFEFRYWRDSEKRENLGDEAGFLYKSLTTVDQKDIGVSLDQKISFMGKTFRRLSRARMNALVFVGIASFFYGADLKYTLQTWVNPDSIKEDIINSSDKEYPQKLRRFVTKKLDLEFDEQGRPILTNKLVENTYERTVNEIFLARAAKHRQSIVDAKVEKALAFTTEAGKLMNQYRKKTKVLEIVTNESLATMILTAMQKETGNVRLNGISKKQYKEWIEGKRSDMPSNLKQAFSPEGVQYLLEIKSIELKIQKRVRLGDSVKEVIADLEYLKLEELINNGVSNTADGA